MSQKILHPLLLPLNIDNTAIIEKSENHSMHILNTPADMLFLSALND